MSFCVVPLQDSRAWLHISVDLRERISYMLVNCCLCYTFPSHLCAPYPLISLFAGSDIASANARKEVALPKEG